MKIIGHRGAKGLAPENTKDSFNAALAAHVDGIELDVRTTKDGELIVCHDAKIDILSIAESKYDELKKLHPELLTIRQALEIIGNRCEVIIELKKGCDVDVLTSELKNITMPDAVYFCSFEMSLLHAIKKVLPNVKVIVNEKWSGIRASYRCRKLGTKYIEMNQRWLWFGFIHSVSKNGYNLIAYTVNNPKKARKWAKFGLYATITDRPDLFEN